MGATASHTHFGLRKAPFQYLFTYLFFKTMPKISDKRIIKLKDIPSYENINLELVKLGRKQERELQKKYPEYATPGSEDQTKYDAEMLMTIIKKWDLQDENGKVLPINADNLEYLDQMDKNEIVAALYGFTGKELMEIGKKKVLQDTSLIS